MSLLLPWQTSGVVTGSFTADAVLQTTQSGAFTADAVIPGGSVTYEASFTADAFLLAVRSATFTGDAVLKRATSAALTGDAVLKKVTSASLTADAIKLKTSSGTFTANAVLKKITSATITADSILTGAFRADAVKKKTFTKLFTADALLQAFSFTASAYIVAAPVAPGTKIPAVIKVNGVDITDDVIIKGATFTQAVNARPGQFSFEVKDDDHIYNFVSGGRVTVDIQNRRAFDGYLDRATLRYAFPVDITTAPNETPRIWRLEGPDLNILFQKRLVFDQVNPNADLPTYAAGTHDVTIIRDFMRNYIDLDGDDITYDGITHVGSPNPDADGYIINIGSTWGAAMAAIGQLPGAVWGLTQDRDLFYEDDSTESAPFRLSDTPDNDVSYGYREFTWTDDGTRLVNDAQVWGAGTGSPEPVYSETIDAASVTEHGRWQLPGQFRSDMFRQATVDDAADSIVYGSPQNLHGGKDPYVLVECTIKQHGLRAGHKVRFINEVYNLDKVLPIRRMTITFVNLYDVLYRLELTQEIDEPWFFAEFAGYSFPPFRPPPFKPPRYKPPRWIVDPPIPCDCGITDTFTRSVTGGWGISDAGQTWVLSTSGSATAYVNGSSGVVLSTSTDSALVELGSVTEGLVAPIEVYFQFQLGAIGGTLDKSAFSIGNSEVRFDSGTASHLLPGSGAELQLFENGGGAAAIKRTYTAGINYNCHLLYTPGTDINVSVWEDGDPEPGSWDITLLSVNPRGSLKPSFTLDTSQSSNLLYINYLDIVGVDSCSNTVFDDFTRTVSSGNQWSAITPSADWAWTQGGPGQGTLTVNGTQGVWTCTSSTLQHSTPTIFAPVGSSAPWANLQFGDVLTMRASFQITVIGSSSTNYGYLAFQFGDNTVLAEAGMQITSASGFGTYFATGWTGTDSIPQTTWTANVDYNVIVQYEPGVAIRLKFWLASTSEPAGWMAVGDDTDAPLLGASGDPFFAVDFFGRTSKAIKINYISFDNANPCVECTSSVIDDFENRSIALAFPPSAVQGNFWGDTSGEGITWRNSGLQGGLPNTEWGVVDGVGVVRLTRNGGGSVNAGAGLNIDGSDTFPWFLVGNGFPTGLITGSTIDFSIDVMADSTEGYFELILADNVATDIGGIVVSLDWDTITGGFLFDTYDDSGVQDTTILSINTWYTIRVRVSGGAAAAKYWATGTSEPGWMLSLESTSPPWTPGELTIWFHASSGAGYQYYYVDNLTMNTDCNGDGTPAVVGAPAGVGAYGCETPTRLSSTLYSLSYPPVAGTTEVYLNGRFMRLTYDYSVQVSEQTITFVMPVDAADTVYVCYVAGAMHDYVGT